MRIIDEHFADLAIERDLLLHVILGVVVLNAEVSLHISEEHPADVLGRIDGHLALAAGRQCPRDVSVLAERLVQIVLQR